MDIYRNIEEINSCLDIFREQGLSVGFVPTMGALHEGHLALIRRCKSECNITVCSIFVNPLQFNRRDDFEHYPVTTELDVALLNGANCDFLFCPDVKEMYPGEIASQYDFGDIEHIMEGRFRPGHFNGMALAVKRLFDIIKPKRAYFGEKDYQQLLIIRRLVEMHDLNIDIIPCPTVREPDGLAMSSRNRLLSSDERKIAPAVYQIISESVDKAKELDPSRLKEWVSKQVKEFKQMELEYYELSDAADLEPVSTWKEGQEVVACIAVYLGNVRLIDNIRFFLHNFALW
jgi:pantoate--beta-alanine ligase